MNFIANKDPQQHFAYWIEFFNIHLKYGVISFKFEVEQKFYYLTTSTLEVAKKLLTFTPHKTL